MQNYKSSLAPVTMLIVTNQAQPSATRAIYTLWSHSQLAQPLPQINIPVFNQFKLLQYTIACPTIPLIPLVQETEPALVPPQQRESFLKRRASKAQTKAAALWHKIQSKFSTTNTKKANKIQAKPKAN
ncbi:UNVERIFIED_CONTAM: hypothetical protein HDU68_007385 [Siphonaria sp. JEL0065]|nr:hypothetical protein HDU68_007385 [Siphonaria sp. JEL0065]